MFRFIFLLLCLYAPLHHASAQIVINEVQASNATTLADEDGDYEDWIELYNTGNTTINLGGYGLSDDVSRPYRWIFPSVELPPNTYLLIWASGKHRTHPDHPLHTNFGISNGNEGVILTSPSGTRIDEIPPLYIPTDYSYGRSANGSSDFYFFSAPTPGSANPTNSEALTLPPPTFSVSGGTYTSPFTLEISTHDDSQIYYTTDGSVPQPGTALRYNNPLQVTGSFMIRARSFKNGYQPSMAVSEIYTRISSELQSFSSDMPLVIINQYNIEIQPGDRTPAAITIMDNDQNGRYSLVHPDHFTSRMDVNKRGSSSLSFPKNMFGLHLRTDSDGNRNESLLGLPSEHNWILYAPYTDMTLMRNVVAYQLSEDMGWYAPRTRYVELFLHSGNGPVGMSHYHGVYVLVERIKWDNNRVDITKIEPTDNQEPEISGGYIIKKDRLNEGEHGFRTSRGTLLAHVRPSESEITSQQQQWIRNFMSDFETALYGNNFRDPELGYEKFVNVNSFIDHFLHTELLKEIDGYRLSTFMYKDRNGKLVMGPVWDYNLSLGIADYAEGWLPEGWYYPVMGCYIGCGVRNWYVRLMQDPDYMTRMQTRWWQLRQTIFSRDYLMEMIDANSAELAEAQVRNFERWPTLGTYVWPNWYIGETWEDEVNWMKHWLDQRLDWMDSQMGTPPEIVDDQPFSFSATTDTFEENFSNYRGTSTTLNQHMFVDWDQSRLSEPFTGVGHFQSADPATEYGNFVAYTSDGNQFSFGIRERAPGDLRDARLYLYIKNDTDAPIASFRVSYDVEAWFIGDRRNRIRLKYDNLFQSNERGTFETDIFSTHNPSSETTVGTKVNGKLSEHRTTVSGTVNLLSLDDGTGSSFGALAPGESAYFRWQISNADGDGGALRSGLGITNIRISTATDTHTENESDLPQVVTLEQNYPNPFNPVTTISYSLPTQKQVQLEVYNMLGQKVSELVNSVQSAGVYSVSFDAGTLSSGMYMYQLRAGNVIETRKMMLIK